MRTTPRPALDGLSIGYRAIKSAIHGKNSPARRTLLAVKLFEVSLADMPAVDMPANGKARVTSVESVTADNDNFTRALRELCDSIKRSA
jgi:hypothetical protein